MFTSYKSLFNKEKKINKIDGSDLRRELDEITKKLIGSAMSTIDVDSMDSDDFEMVQAAARLNRHCIEYMEHYEDIINDNIEKLDRIEEMVYEMHDKLMTEVEE